MFDFEAATALGFATLTTSLRIQVPTITEHYTIGRLLFVVHIAFEDEQIRIISARKATPEERKFYDS
jgi:uncharacterized DUF497 family protein